jgi:subtilisin family serine protease
MPGKIFNSEGVGSEVDGAQSIVYAVNNGADIISIAWGEPTIFQLEADALNYAYSHGVVAVAAAGNDIYEKIYPAGYDTVIAVASTDNTDSRPWWSNYGSWVDIAAPGDDLYTTTLDDNYNYFDGTSYSAPLVAGLAGLILSRDPVLSPEEVKSIICDNVDPYDSEEYIGTGRINAYKALSAVNSPPDTPSITGPSSGTPGTEYSYTFVAVDPNGDDVSYYIDWGDGSTSEWTALGSSGEDVELAHTWDAEGDYTIKAKAKDEYDAESDWGELTVSMPKPKTINPLFLRSIECSPLLARLLIL